MLDQNKIGRFIYELRTKKGISQNDLSSMIPISRQAVSNWEQGKSIPDSSTLLILSKIFDVSINELLLGERSTKETKEKKDELQKVMLHMLDDNNTKRRKLKIITIFSVAIITLLLLIFFSYYFFTSYNTIKVYKVSAESKNFAVSNGILVTTKDKSYFRLGELLYDSNINIDKVRIYYLGNDKNKRVIYDGTKTNILVNDVPGYNEYFNTQKINHLYMEITYNGTETINIKLNFSKDFSNSNLLHEKYYTSLE